MDSTVHERSVGEFCSLLLLGVNWYNGVEITYPRRVEMSYIAKLGQEFGQYVVQLTGQLLLSISLLRV